MWGESIFATDLSGVESVSMAGISLMLQLCVESWGIQQMVSLITSVHIQDRLSPCTVGAQPVYYYGPDENNAIVIENVNCYWDESRLRNCPYSNHSLSVPSSCQSGGGTGVRCKAINNIEFSATVNNSVLVTWEYNNITSHQPSSFNVRCNGQRHYNIIISVSNGTSRLSDIVGDLLPNASYDCCVLAKYERPGRTEINCASIRSEDLLPPTTISDTNMTATVVGTVLGCVIVILLVLLVVCGGALFQLLRSRTSSEVPKR